ncbi:FAD-dependent oxidoreductase [Acidisoma cellulosilytica]|uniref:FAD-dependent oxidoreductase n=1 Tax=Acidisoma cellulosilyticum TaxID=2802395 RepID=A0A964E7J1_9PROT|nr:FAD-dependent oxidoreductase [Acidisoma cellulosilyticum]MCB8884058.1 FAD-dependent oxidoreductase [Acidisoma cellulosilyticum]
MQQKAHSVASFAQIPDGGMLAVQVDGEKVLLLRDGSSVTAVSGTCTHAGGPLSEGVRHGNRIICPWHKAAFCNRTGEVLDPPAVDSLPSFSVRVEAGHVLVSVPPAKPVLPKPSNDKRCFVIIGAGAAGAVAAQTLREAGFGGRIVMLDHENRVPYDRTILSKYFLAGSESGEKSPLQTQSFYNNKGIERLTATVQHIDIRDRRIDFSDGSSISYDAALVASGGSPTHPQLPGADLGNAFVLRSRADADAILAQAERSASAVVVGASFIGMEVAASLRERGLAVTVVAKDKVPFAARFGEPVGKAFQALHEQKGVEFRLNSEIASLQGDKTVRSVLLKSGEQITTDLVIFGFGMTPSTTFASELPRTDDGGILVDSWLRASDTVYAAGDIACFPYSGEQDPIRVEHWRVAQQQGRIAALNMLGQAKRYDAVPVFWTIQYLKRLDYIGQAREWDDLIIHGDIKKLEFLSYYVKDGKVLAAAGVGRDQDTAALGELFEMQKTWAPETLGDSPAKLLESLNQKAADDWDKSKFEITAD